MTELNAKLQLSAAAQQLASKVVGVSPALHEVRTLVAHVAPTDSTVLLLGESGTGKEVVARAIHDTSGRVNGPFIPVNCGAIPAELLESELFGHEKGAFTGAIAARKGRFEMAEGGTLFLDEIGDMPFEMQVKLLRVLQERTFERVGSTKSQRCDVRIVSATHQHLEQKVEDGTFRMDLFYRLNVFPIDVPPLRERIDDIPVLAQRFIDQIQKEQGITLRLMPSAVDLLCEYHWPGNVRELGNLIERLSILHPNRDVYAADLPTKYQLLPQMRAMTRAGEAGQGRPRGNGLSAMIGTDGSAGPQAELFSAIEVTREEREDLSALYAPAPSVPLPPPTPAALDEPIDLKAHLIDVEKSLILAALEKTDWVNAQAAKLLSLQRTTLVEKMRKYDIQRPDAD